MFPAEPKTVRRTVQTFRDPCLWHGTRVAVADARGGSWYRPGQRSRMAGHTALALGTDLAGCPSRLGAGARNPDTAGPGGERQRAGTPQLLAVRRLEARLVSLPVIEQAKGVLMAQQGCDADQAFDLLCQTAQRSNLPVRDLAEQIVKKAQQGEASTQGTGG